MAFMIMKIVVAFAIVGLVVGFRPVTTRSSARYSRLSMAFGLPSSFDSVFQQFGGAKVIEVSVAKVTEVATAAPVVVAAPVVQQVIAVSPSPPATAMSGGEFAAGLGLGLAPYLLIPVLALNSVKGLIKPAKPLPVPVAPTTTVGAYTKSLQDGLNEGIKELFSEQNADTDLTKKGIKLSAAGFASAIALTAVLFLTSGKEESKVVAKPVAPSAVVKIAAPVTAPVKVATPAPVVAAPVAVVAPVVVAPLVAPVVVAAPAPAVVDNSAAENAAADKAATERVASEKAQADKVAAEKVASEKVAAEKVAAEKISADKVAADKVSADKAASDKVVADKVASDKVASEKAAAEAKAAAAKVVAPAKVEKAAVVEYVPVVPKGMEVEKVDLSALNALRVSVVSCSTNSN